MDLLDIFCKISINTDDFAHGIETAQKKAEGFAKNLSGVSSSISKAYSGIKDVLTPVADGFKAVEGVGQKAGDAVMAGLKGFAAAATAVGGFGTAAVKSGMQFDATMSEVSAISGATGAEFDALRNKAIEMGAKTQFSASEAAEALTYMGMAGWKTEDMLGGIAGIMDLAAASGEDLATTSDIVTDALTAFGMKANESGRFADVMAVAATNANTDVGMMGETFKYVAPVAGSLGYSIEDSALAIGLMANSSIKASQAGTSLRSIMTRLATNAGATKNEMGAAEILTNKLGVSFFDAAGNARDLSDVLLEAREAWQGLSAEEATYYAKKIAGQEAISGWLAIMNASTEDVDKLTNALENANGAAAEMAAIRLDNLASDITYMKSAFESLQIAISDSLTPTLREFAQFGQKAMKNLLEGFQGNGVSGFMSALSGIVTDGVTMLAQKAPEFASVSLQFVQALATGILDARFEILEAGNNILITLSEGVSSWLSSHMTEMQEFGVGIVRMIFQGFLSAGEIISENIGQFIPLIASAFLLYHEALFTVGMDILGAIGRGIVDNKEEIQYLASNTITYIVTALRDNAPAIIEGGIALLEALVGAILENASMIGEAAVDIVSHLAESIGKTAPDLIPAAVEAILKFAEGLTSPESLNGLINGALSLIEGLVEGIIKAVPLLIEYGPEIVANLITGILSALPKLLEIGGQLIAGLLEGLVMAIASIPEAIAKVVGAIVDGFKALFGIHSPSTVFAEMGVLLIEGLLQGISGAWESIVEFFGGAVEALTQFLGEAWDGIRQAASEAWEAIGKAISDVWGSITQVWDAATGFFDDIWNSVKVAAEEAAEKIGGALSDARDAVTSAWDDATDFFGGVWNDITNVFSGVWDHFKGIGRNMLEGLWNGIGDKISWLKSKVSGVVDTIKGWFTGKSGFDEHSPSKWSRQVFRYVMDGGVEGLDDGTSRLMREVNAITYRVKSGMDFGTASVGLVANTAGYSAPRSAQNSPQAGFGGAGGMTVNIYNPEKRDAVTEAREWQKTAQRMAIGYV